jgi:hypothetical protein
LTCAYKTYPAPNIVGITDQPSPVSIFRFNIRLDYALLKCFQKSVSPVHGFLSQKYRVGGPPLTGFQVMLQTRKPLIDNPAISDASQARSSANCFYYRKCPLSAVAL